MRRSDPETESTVPSPLSAASESSGDSAGRLIVGALLIFTTGDGRVMFVRQQRGPYAGSLLLPGGKVEDGESLDDTARREAFEEAGVRAGTVTACGVYDMTGPTADGRGYRFVMFVFRAGSDAVRVAAGGHHVDDVVLTDPGLVQPHPTVQQILNDAGVAAYAPAGVQQRLRNDGITMRTYPMAGTRC
ncbi:NUDIX hydrolase [Dactylosporangium sp. NPDC051485]|uniref:NUDIX hydrolase n=1 Tax=Dactylosporangium sp. NPDC051485 TaxID=3154846 RepID=UPI003433C990